MSETKPGVKTTEFYVTVLTQITALCATLGILSPEQHDIMVDVVGEGQQYIDQSMPVINDMVTRALGLIAMLGSAFGYAHSRAKTKGGVK